ncbi:Protein of unknown function [Cotesia congregata]|uniref:Uncharacterized protein n=1 Tax=Cotesia congregata TaxID=51543 RepID=A0A8J2H9J8_COTCN|nr:Protein of unknown function [Cotesia congregata]
MKIISSARIKRFDCNTLTEDSILNGIAIVPGRLPEDIEISKAAEDLLKKILNPDPRARFYWFKSVIISENSSVVRLLGSLLRLALVSAKGSFNTLARLRRNLLSATRTPIVSIPGFSFGFKLPVRLTTMVTCPGKSVSRRSGRIWST